MAALKLSTAVEVYLITFSKSTIIRAGLWGMSFGFTALADQRFLYIRTATGTILLLV
jgi:hypothetical protein